MTPATTTANAFACRCGRGLIVVVFAIAVLSGFVLMLTCGAGCSASDQSAVRRQTVPESVSRPAESQTVVHAAEEPDEPRDIEEAPNLCPFERECSCVEQVCSISCPSGFCNQGCVASTCRMSCAGGECDVRCSAQNAECESDCSGGSCRQTCAGFNSCIFHCEGGGSLQVCEPYARCRFDCAGGGCIQGCSRAELHRDVDPRFCDLNCDGGDCTQYCEAPDQHRSRCALSCPGGGCSVEASSR